MLKMPAELKKMPAFLPNPQNQPRTLAGCFGDVTSIENRIEVEISLAISGWQTPKTVT